jgi:DNA-binding LytR/AlgR family response regulator
MVVQIAICDDEKILLENLEQQIGVQFSLAGVEYQIKTYTNGMDLIADYENYLFDVIFLDIEMPELDGLSVAEKMRITNPFVSIIFITNRDDLVFQSIRYRPFRFIRKHYIAAELSEAVQAIANKLKAENQYFTVSFNNSALQIRIIDIIYIESYKHDIYIYCHDEKYRIKDNLGKLEKEFEVFGFIRVHSGFLVNYRYIYSIDKAKIILLNKDMVPLSRYRIETVKQKLQLFARGTER